MSLTRSSISAREAKVFEPSSFASRKAEWAARGELGPRPRRLVSLGVQERWLEGFGPKKKGQMVKIQYFFDQDHPNYYFAKALPHGSSDRIDRGGVDDPTPGFRLRQAGAGSRGA
jgi:hypothetical protein